jgi:hypothetical protein
MECTDAIVATTFWSDEFPGPTCIKKAKEAIVHATEADRFSVQSIQGVPTAGNPKGLRYATTKNTLINDILLLL